MSRPDLTEQRTEQILDAYEYCIARYGIDGASLEMIAEQANVKRSIIRHYIGNRDDVLLALTRRMTARTLQLLDDVIDLLPNKNRSKVLVDYLFLPSPTSEHSSGVAMDILIATSSQHPRCRDLIRGFMDSMTARVAEQLQIAHPKSSRKQCWSVANGIMAMTFVFESLDPLGLGSRYQKSWKQNAILLLKTLK